MSRRLWITTRTLLVPSSSSTAAVAEGQQQQQQQRCKATLAPAAATATATATAADEAEWNAAKPFNLMPGRRSFPIIGTAWVMFPLVGAGIDLSRMMDLHMLHYKMYGSIWRDIYPGKPPVVSVANPADIEKLFRTEGRFPERPGFDTIKLYRSKRVEQFTIDSGIMAGKGEQWWTVRAKAQQPLLKTKNIQNYMPILAQIADEFIERIRMIRPESSNEMKPDFINEMYRWALESVAVVGFNTRLGCLDPNLAPDSEAQKMIQAANLSFAAVNELEFGLPIWKYYTTPLTQKLFQAQDFFTEMALKYISKTIEDIKKRPVDSQEDPSILEEMLGRGMTPKDTIVTVIDLLMTGIDTTSHTTSFLLYFLATNPEKQEKLRQEILTVVGPKGSPITPAALNEMHYLKACIKESLRLMPATLGNGRITDRNLVLSGYQVPKGALVATLHQMMGHLDEYFPNAQAFIPERWIKGDPHESKHSPYTVMPFGYGVRMCIGRRLAELEMWQLTIKMLQNFKVEYHYGKMGAIARLVNIPDKALQFRFIDLK